MFEQPSTWEQVQVGNRSRFFLEGGTKLAPGQWRVDDAGSLFYRPRAEEALSDTEVIATAAPELLQLNGVDDVQITGLILEHADGEPGGWPNQPGDGQAATACTTAAIHICNSSNVKLSNVTVMRTGSYGVWVHGASTDVTVEHSVITDLGVGGIRIGDGGAGGHAAPAWNQRIVVNNTLVASGGRRMAAAPGVLVHSDVYGFVLTHLEIVDFAWAGISAGQVSSYVTRTPKGYDAASSIAACTHGHLPWPTPAAVNVISWNRIHQIAMGPDRLSDNGGLYLPVISASVHHNEVYDVGFYNFAGLGIYAEGGGCNVSIHSNIFHDLAGSCIDLHWFYINVDIINNVCEAEPEVNVHGKMTPPMHSMGGIINLTLKRNIISLPPAAKRGLSPAFVYGGQYCVVANETRRSVGKLDFSFGAVDSNVYYAEAKMKMVFPKSSRPALACSEIDKQGVNFSTWQRAGFDRHSIIGNPGFVGDGNFSLRADSSARKLGIESLDSSMIGFFSSSIEATLLKTDDSDDGSGSSSKRQNISCASGGKATLPQEENVNSESPTGSAAALKADDDDSSMKVSGDEQQLVQQLLSLLDKNSRRQDVVPKPAEMGYNVRDFGAVGDGVSDDASAWQACIDAAQATGRAIQVPAGQYLVSRMLVVHLDRKGNLSAQPLRIVGEGPERTGIIGAKTLVADAVISIDPHVTHIHLQGFEVTALGKATGYAMLAPLITRSKVSDLRFYGGSAAGLKLGGWINSIIDCGFGNVPGPAALVIENEANAIDVVRCSFEGNVGVAILINGGSNVRVESNTIEGNGGPGVVANAVGALSLRSNYFVRPPHPSYTDLLTSSPGLLTTMILPCLPAGGQLKEQLYR